MGLSISNLNPRVNEDESGVPIFIVPNHIRFTANQIEIMSSVGQQPGVPFYINETGPQRLKSRQVEVKSSECLASIQIDTIFLKYLSNDEIYVSFVYDALCESEVVIYVGACELSTSTKIRIPSSRYQLGPFSLTKGFDVAWSTKKVSHPILVQHIPGLNESCSVNEYDIIFILNPLSNVETYSQKSDLSENENEKKNSKNNSLLGFQTIRSVLKFEPQSIEEKKNDNISLSKSVVMSEITCTRVDAYKFNFTSGYTTQLKVEFQKMLMNSGGLYFKQEIYGTKKDEKSEKKVVECGNNESGETKKELSEMLKSNTLPKILETIKEETKEETKEEIKDDIVKEVIEEICKNIDEKFRKEEAKESKEKQNFYIEEINKEATTKGETTKIEEPKEEINQDIKQEAAAEDEEILRDDEIDVRESVYFESEDARLSSRLSSRFSSRISQISRFFGNYTSAATTDENMKQEEIKENEIKEETKEDIIDEIKETKEEEVKEDLKTDVNDENLIALEKMTLNTEFKEEIDVETNNNSNEISQESGIEMKSFGSKTKLPVVESKPVANGAFNIFDDLDEADECVICLSEEKVVVLYPCRHLCLCVTCSESLAATQNKCPICRTTAHMLILIGSNKNASINKEIKEKEEKNGESKDEEIKLTLENSKYDEIDEPNIKDEVEEVFKETKEEIVEEEKSEIEEKLKEIESEKINEVEKGFVPQKEIKDENETKEDNAIPPENSSFSSFDVIESAEVLKSSKSSKTDKMLNSTVRMGNILSEMMKRG